MLRTPGATLLMVVILTRASIADENKEQRATRLPKPLNGVAVDVSYFAEGFRLVDVAFFESGKFETPDPRPRVVKEETFVWTLEAIRDVESGELNKVLANPFPRVKFLKRQDDNEVSADARVQGYGLFHDGRWLGKKGPDLKKGERIRVWTHLGKEGSAGLLQSNAIKVVFAKDATKE